MKIFKFELGVEVEDLVTGFKGTVTARTQWLNKCIQYCVKPKLDKDGKFPEGQYFDEEQLKKISAGLNIKAKPSGGPKSDVAGDRYGA